MQGGHRDRNFPPAILYSPDMSRHATVVLSLLSLILPAAAMPAPAQERSQTPRVLYTLTVHQPHTRMVSATALIGGQEGSQTPRVLCTLTLDQPQTQMVSVIVLIGGVEGEQIDLMLPIWRPGR